jgi:Uma2 family endonuclease
MEKFTIVTNNIFSSEQLEAILYLNRDLQIEIDTKNNLIVMSPTYSETGIYNQEINFQLGLWKRKYNLGYVFDSSAGFKLPSGAVRSPDASFILKERWNELSKEQKKSFAPIAPDFIIELRSSTDSLRDLQEKMQEWIQNGVKMGWLIDISAHKVYIY